ncbi:MAG: hypothetical protein IH599_06630 [Bacteroidales bacterium]|nr:hypothetical protein [Bacteroidales bacterium]
MKLFPSFQLVLFVALFFFTCPLLAQDHDHHDHHRNELGLENALIYLPSEEALAYGIHLHYLHNFTESPFGLGLALERIFDEHGHTTAGIALGYRLLEPMHLSITPGLSIEDGHDHELSPSLHGEVLYEFLFGHFHIGPALSAGWSPEDVHYGLGLHLGIDIW